jgi:hypothetical protein
MRKVPRPTCPDEKSLRPKSTPSGTEPMIRDQKLHLMQHVDRSMHISIELSHSRGLLVIWAHQMMEAVLGFKVVINTRGRLFVSGPDQVNCHVKPSAPNPLITPNPLSYITPSDNEKVQLLNTCAIMRRLECLQK